WLIFFRVLQGIGGGGLAPVEQAILVDTFPADKRAAAFALYSMAIVTAMAIVALVAAVIWALRYPDPVVELALLKERNFAISNAFYFMFGFTLFGSTVLIPQMLQSLYGYTATDAGLVLGPGAMVIVLMAPLVVQMVRRIPVSW